MSSLRAGVSDDEHVPRGAGRACTAARRWSRAADPPRAARASWVSAAHGPRLPSSSGNATVSTPMGHRVRAGPPDCLSTGNRHRARAADQEAVMPTFDEDVVVNGTTTVVRRGDGAVLLNLSTERHWEFRQRGTGQATALELA